MKLSTCSLSRTCKPSRLLAPTPTLTAKMPIRTPTAPSHLLPRRLLTTTSRYFAGTPNLDKGTQNSRPHWPGRHGDDHVLNRDKLDAQGKASNEAREQKERGEEGSSAISQKDERNSNQKAKDEHPEAPGPVIGMNSERGKKGA